MGDPFHDEEECDHFYCIDLKANGKGLLYVLIGLVIFSGLFDYAKETFEEYVERHDKVELEFFKEKLFAELMTMGFISFMLFLANSFGAKIPGITDKEESKEVFEYMHMLIFFATMFFVIYVIYIKFSTQWKFGNLEGIMKRFGTLENYIAYRKQHGAKWWRQMNMWKRLRRTHPKQTRGTMLIWAFVDYQAKYLNLDRELTRFIKTKPETSEEMSHLSESTPLVASPELAFETVLERNRYIVCEYYKRITDRVVSHSVKLQWYLWISVILGLFAMINTQGSPNMGFAVSVIDNYVPGLSLGLALILYGRLQKLMRIISFSPHVLGTTEGGAAKTGFLTEPQLAQSQEVQKLVNTLTGDVVYRIGDNEMEKVEKRLNKAKDDKSRGVWKVSKHKIRRMLGSGKRRDELNETHFNLFSLRRPHLELRITQGIILFQAFYFSILAFVYTDMLNEGVDLLIGLGFAGTLYLQFAVINACEKVVFFTVMAAFSGSLTSRATIKRVVEGLARERPKNKKNS